MAFVCIDVHTMTGNARDIVQRSSDAMLSAFRARPGFVECDFVANDTQLIAISRWRSKEHATESAVQAASVAHATRDEPSQDGLTVEHHFAGQLSASSRAG